MTKVVQISKTIEWDMGHRVPKHESKCCNPHGHRYKLEVWCFGPIIEEPGAPDEGMLIDFGDLKTMMTEHIHDVLDHGFMIAESDADLRKLLAYRPGGAEDGYVGVNGWKVIIVDFIPTAENIAVWCWRQLEDRIAAHFRGNLVLGCVKVWETPTSVAMYQGH